MCGWLSIRYRRGWAVLSSLWLFHHRGLCCCCCTIFSLSHRRGLYSRRCWVELSSWPYRCWLALSSGVSSLSGLFVLRLFVLRLRLAELFTWYRGGSGGAGCGCCVGLDVVSGGRGWSKTNHDKRRGSRVVTHFTGLPLPGSPLVFLPPQILRRARTDCSRPRVLPPSSSAGMVLIVVDLRVVWLTPALPKYLYPPR